MEYCFRSAPEDLVREGMDRIVDSRLYIINEEIEAGWKLNSGGNKWKRHVCLVVL